jgi:3-methylcrotonyl-CoA carboxylase alpha subunit
MGAPMKFKLVPDGPTIDAELIGREGSSVTVSVNGSEVSATIEPVPGGMIIQIGKRRRRLVVARVRKSILVSAGPSQFELSPIEERGGHHAHGLTTPEITSPMPGKVLKILVYEGQAVEAGDSLIVLEAMKMETTLSTESAAVVKAIRVATGDMVDHGAVLIELSPAADPSEHESAARRS